MHAKAQTECFRIIRPRPTIVMKEMDVNQKELIDKFLLGQLEPEEQLKWDTEIQDESFREELAFRRDLLLASKSLRRDQLKQEFSAIEKRERSQQPANANIRSFRLMPIAIGIAAALALIFLVWGSFGPKKQDPQVLFAEHFSPYPNHLVMVARDTSIARTPLEHVFEAYEAKRYARVIQLFSQMDSSTLNEISSDYVHLYVGVSYLGNNQPLQAIEELGFLTESENKVFSQPAEWYTGLAYVASNQMEEAKTLIEKVQENHSHSYQEDAQKILPSLD